MPIAPVVDIHLVAETLGQGLECLREQLIDTRKFDGCLGVEVLGDPADDCHLQLYERWESREQYEAYREWRRAGGDVGFGKFKARPNTITYWDATDL